MLARSNLLLTLNYLPQVSAAELLADATISRIVVSDSVPPFRLPADGPVARKLQVVSAAPLFAQAIRDCHESWAN